MAAVFGTRRTGGAAVYGVEFGVAALSFTPGPATLTLTGFVPTFAQSANQAFSPAPATLTLSGLVPTFTQSAGVSFSPTPAVQTFTGYAPSFSSTATPESLITEDGTGLVNAESYASVATTDAYWSARGNPAAWSTLSTGDKEANLRQATEYLAKFAGKWKGCRLTAAQALDWPRYGVVVDGFTLNSGMLPQQLVRAVCELALKAADGPLTVDEPAQVKSETVGPIAITYADGARQQTRFAYVETLLAPLVSGANSIRITRA